MKELHDEPDAVTLGGREMPECTCDIGDGLECPVYAYLDEEAACWSVVNFLRWGASLDEWRKA